MNQQVNFWDYFISYFGNSILAYIYLENMSTNFLWPILLRNKRSMQFDLTEKLKMNLEDLTKINTSYSSCVFSDIVYLVIKFKAIYL